MNALLVTGVLTPHFQEPRSGRSVTRLSHGPPGPLRESSTSTRRVPGRFAVSQVTFSSWVSVSIWAPLGTVSTAAGAASSTVWNCQVGPVTVPDPSLTVAYHSYVSPRWSPAHGTETVAPDGTPGKVAIGWNPPSPPLRSQSSVNWLLESGSLS